MLMSKGGRELPAHGGARLNLVPAFLCYKGTKNPSFLQENWEINYIRYKESVLFKSVDGFLIGYYTRKSNRIGNSAGKQVYCKD